MHSFNVLHDIWIIFLSSITAFSIYSLIKCKNSVERELELHHRKHNCVLIFSGSTITGWPGFEGKYQISARSIDRAFEPICYFIGTANKSLDIAVMTIRSKIILDTIISVLKKGVRVRLLHDYDAKHRIDLRTTLQYGAEIHYIRNTNEKHESLFHHKYAVKDYSDCEGYVICGSTNWTIPSFTQNFEDLVFTSNHFMASAFHNNFEEMWDSVKINETRNK